MECKRILTEGIGASTVSGGERRRRTQRQQTMTFHYSADDETIYSAKRKLASTYMQPNILTPDVLAAYSASICQGEKSMK